MSLINTNSSKKIRRLRLFDDSSSFKGYFFALPAFIFIFIILIFPLFIVFQRSFLTIFLDEEIFFSFRNYYLVFKDPIYWKSLLNNLKLLGTIPIITIISFLFSVLLFERIKGWKVYRFIIIIPYILSITVAGIIFSELFQYYGVINNFLQKIGLDFLVQDWLGVPKVAIYSIGFVIIWKQLGFGIIIFLARLMSIDEQLLEAARIDGASWGKTVFYIIVPQCGTTILFFIVMNFITLVSWVFNYIFIMTRGGPIKSTFVMEMYIYNNAFGNYLFEKASAAAVTLLFIALIGILIQFIIKKKLIGINYE